MKVIESSVYGIRLSEARHLTPQEESQFKPEFQKSVLIGLENTTKLPHLRRNDLPHGPGPYCFCGYSNTVWEVTDQEWDSYVTLEAERAAEEKAKQIIDEIRALETAKAAAEAQKDLPDEAEAKRRIREWIITQNEGGDGYVPHIYTSGEYARICARLKELRQIVQ